MLKGEKGPRRDVVLLNSAYALVAANKAKTPKAAIKLAKESIDSGRALEKLNQLRAYR